MSSVTQRALPRMLPNSKEPNPFKRRIISRVEMSTMLYGRRHTPWGRHFPPVVFVFGFRTMCDEAVLVLAKAISIDILADEMNWIYFCHFECPEQTATIKAEERRTSMHKWRLRL